MQLWSDTDESGDVAKVTAQGGGVGEDLHDQAGFDEGDRDGFAAPDPGPTRRQHRRPGMPTGCRSEKGGDIAGLGVGERRGAAGDGQRAVWFSDGKDQLLAPRLRAAAGTTVVLDDDEEAAYQRRLATRLNTMTTGRSVDRWLH